MPLFSVVVPGIMLSDKIKRKDERSVLTPLVMERIFIRMPMQDFTGAPVIRGDNNPLMTRHTAV